MYLPSPATPASRNASETMGILFRRLSLQYAWLVYLAKSSRLHLFESLTQSVELLRDFFMSFGQAAALFDQIAQGLNQKIDFLLFGIIHRFAPDHPLPGISGKALAQRDLNFLSQQVRSFLAPPDYLHRLS